MYEFPFEVPADLTAVTDEELAELSTRVREHAQALLNEDNADPDALVATRDLFNSVTAETNRRALASSARGDLTAALDTPPAPAPEPAPADPAPAPSTDPVPADPAPASVTASTGGTSTLDTPPAEVTPAPVIMTTASDVPGFNSGMQLETFDQAAEAISNRLDTYSQGGGAKRQTAARRVGKHQFLTRPGHSAVRHGAVMFRREFPEDLRIREGASNPLAVLDHAASERRLPGGSLVESARRQVESGKSLTAAVGWCAPSEVIYDLCELETVDGILDLPEVQAARGGFQIPSGGGPDFSVIWDGIGNEGDVALTEYDIENGTEKVCLEVPCPEFEDVRLGVAYACLTGSLLQRRGYPEVIQRFARGTMVALAHKINEAVISQIVSASTGATVIPTVPGNDDDASRILSAVELAIEDTKYRNRMARAATLEVVLPAWTLAVIRASLARRTGVPSWAVTDAQILEAFAVRKAVPRFVYDWQDAFSGLVGGPGGENPITAFPDDLQFLVYPAGTWVKAVRDVVNLDTIYDNALLTSNQYTALFAEDGFATLQMCPDSRLYQVAVDPADVIACCAGEVS